LSISNKYNPLVKAIRTALLTGVAASMAVAPSAFAADEEEDDEEENTVTITGSRIKRSDLEGALPVTVIDREMIELSGESNASDFLRNMTFNSAGSFRPQSGSSAQGVSSINLRGVGSSRSLILVDGRRLPMSPATGSSQDLNTIPMGAIERIEVLSDGASAIYGSDALGGVVNIITRQDYQGAELSFGSAEVSLPFDGGDREFGSLMFGAASDTSSLMGGVSWNKRDIIFARDNYWNQGGASIYGNSYTTINADGSPNFDWMSIPDGAGGTACDFDGTGFFTLGARCAYDYTMVSADEASTGNRSLWLKASHEFNDDWSVWMNSSFNKTSSFGRYAPVPDSSYWSSALDADSPNNPTNPNGNVWNGTSTVGESVHWWHRFDALGNRDSYVETTLEDVQAGITGNINGIEIDLGMRKTKNEYQDIGYNYLLRKKSEALLSPDNSIISRSITVTGNAPSRSERLIRDPVIVTVFSSSSSSSSSAANALGATAIDAATPVNSAVRIAFTSGLYLFDILKLISPGCIGGYISKRWPVVIVQTSQHQHSLNYWHNNSTVISLICEQILTVIAPIGKHRIVLFSRRIPENRKIRNNESIVSRIIYKKPCNIRFLQSFFKSQDQMSFFEYIRGF